MKKEFLKDYEAKEMEELQRYTQQAKSRGLTENDFFPDLSRFSKANFPIVLCDRHVYALDKEKIWSQIPFAGTLILPIHNTSPENFLSVHGFEIIDIPKLIDLSKETGKVQFTLAGYPTSFAGLDFLEPIFYECRPPLLQTIPLEGLIDYKTYGLWKEEFYTLSKISLNKYLKNQILELGEGKEYFLNVLSKFAAMYAQLKLLKMDIIIEEMSKFIVDNPEMANFLINGMILATEPLFDGLHANRNICLSRMQMFGMESLVKTNQISFPVEIGKFLMKKLTYLPPSYNACISVIDHYKENELYKILESIDKGIKTRSGEKVVQDTKELGVIMDNIWKDANRLKLQKEGIQNGVSVVLGIVGELATTAIGGQGGFLAGLGFNVADRMLEMNDSSLSDKIVRFVNKNYLATVYDFKKKYPIAE